MRVPFADYNCMKLPGEPGDRWEDDFIMLSDVLPTGYHASTMAKVVPGSSVAIFRPGEEKMAGVLCGIDAVGYQALSRTDPSQEKPMQVIEDLSRVVNATGAIGLIGVYFSGDPRAVNSQAKEGNFMLPLGMLWEKGISIETGQAPVKRYNLYLRDAIVQGCISPGKLVSHRLRLEHGPEAYEKFVQRGAGEGAEYTKIILKPNG